VHKDSCHFHNVVGVCSPSGLRKAHETGASSSARGAAGALAVAARRSSPPGCADRLRIWDRQRRDPGPFVEALQQGMRRAGLRSTEGFHHRNIAALREGHHGFPELVAELLQPRNVDVLVTFSVCNPRGQQATDTIPIVMVTSIDPVASGIIVAFAKPGGNITGLSRLTAGFKRKNVWSFSKTCTKTCARGNPCGLRVSR